MVLFLISLKRRATFLFRILDKIICEVRFNLKLKKNYVIKLPYF